MNKLIDQDFETRVEKTFQILKNTLQEIEMSSSEEMKPKYAISPDGRIGPAAVSHLTGYCERSLKNRRYLCDSPPYYNIGVNGSKVSYRLRELAEWFEMRKGYTVFDTGNGEDDE